MDNDSEEPTIKILVMAEKGLCKRNFIDSFRICLKYRSFDEYNQMESEKQGNVNDAFNARYTRICFIDTPEVDPNASLSENLAVVRSIKYCMHNSGHLNEIICLLHYEPKYYKIYLEWIFTHLFTTELLPMVIKKLFFVFFNGNERTEPVEPTFGNFLKEFVANLSETSWINWPATLDNVSASSEQKQKEKWAKTTNLFQKIFDKIVENKVDIIKLGCKFSNESVSKVIDNFLDILTEIAFIIEDNTVVLGKSNPVQTDNRIKILQYLESFNYCISFCRSPKCASKNMGICCQCKSVSNTFNIKKCTSFMPPSNVCTKCGCSISKHDAVPYKLITKYVNVANQDTLLFTQKYQKFVINTICALTVIKEGYMAKRFKKILQEKIDKDSRNSSPYKNLILLFDEALTQFSESQSDISVKDILKCIETAEQYALISSDYRNAFLSPDIELVARNCDGESDKRNLNLYKEDKHLEKKLNNLNL